MSADLPTFRFFVRDNSMMKSTVKEDGGRGYLLNGDGIGLCQICTFVGNTMVQALGDSVLDNDIFVACVSRIDLTDTNDVLTRRTVYSVIEPKDLTDEMFGKSLREQIEYDVEKMIAIGSVPDEVILQPVAFTLTAARFSEVCEAIKKAG